eukprot:887202-Rhodomonas_salina.1
MLRVQPVLEPAACLRVADVRAEDHRDHHYRDGHGHDDHHPDGDSGVVVVLMPHRRSDQGAH